MSITETLQIRKNEIENEQRSLAVNVIKGGYKTGQVLREFARLENKSFADLVAHLLAGAVYALPADEDWRKFRTLSEERQAIDFCLKMSITPRSRRKQPRRNHRKIK